MERAGQAPICHEPEALPAGLTPAVECACYGDGVTRERSPRPILASAAAAALFLVAAVFSGIAADAPEDHAVVGRWSITSEAGGGVWAFQPGGVVFVTGPGGISSEGTWSAAAGDGEFDASVDFEGTGQQLA